MRLGQNPGQNPAQILSKPRQALGDYTLLKLPFTVLLVLICVDIE
jgi:hypothetical protein